MNGFGSTRPGGGSPLDDIVHWFQDWLGKRRDSLGDGGSLPRAELRPGLEARSRDVLHSSSRPVSSATFDSAFRAVVSAGGDARADGTAGAPRARAGSGDAPAPIDWTRPPAHTLNRDVFYHWLERWYHETDMQTLGGVGEYVRRPWLRVAIGAVQCHLNANTTRAGVAEYLALAQREGPQLPWNVVSGRGGVVNEIAVGRDRVRVRGFHLFTDSVFRQSGLIGGARPAEKKRSVSRRTGISAV